MFLSNRVFVGIIGTAGRVQSEAKMNKELYERMVAKALEIIENEWKLDCKNVVLMSGGAAWSDHVAFELFNSNKFSSLQLFLPCKFDSQTTQFYDKKSADWRTNPGPTANKYHKQFSKKLGRDTLAEIGSLKGKPNVTFQDFNGFHARNKIVAAKSTYLIAFSWANGDAPDDGGTKFTWNLFKEQPNGVKSLKRKRSASDMEETHLDSVKRQKMGEVVATAEEKARLTNLFEKI